MRSQHKPSAMGRNRGEARGVASGGWRQGDGGQPWLSMANGGKASAEPLGEQFLREMVGYSEEE